MAAPIPREPPVTGYFAIGVSLLVDELVTLLQFMWIFRTYFVTKFHFSRPAGGPRPSLDLCYGRSRHIATPIPPPIQRVASSFASALHFESVFKMRARSDGVTNCNAPPFTFTISGSIRYPCSPHRPALQRLHWPQRGQDRYGPSRFIQCFAVGIDRANTHDGRVKANSGKEATRANGLMPRFSASASLIKRTPAPSFRPRRLQR